MFRQKKKAEERKSCKEKDVLLNSTSKRSMCGLTFEVLFYFLKGAMIPSVKIEITQCRPNHKPQKITLVPGGGFRRRGSVQVC